MAIISLTSNTIIINITYHIATDTLLLCLLTKINNVTHIRVLIYALQLCAKITKVVLLPQYYIASNVKSGGSICESGREMNEKMYEIWNIINEHCISFYIFFLYKI